MNKTLNQYAERQGFKKEWAVAPYAVWFERLATLFIPDSEVPSDIWALAKDTRIQFLFLATSLAAALAVISSSLTVWVLLKAIEKTLHHIRRPSYYEQESARRRFFRAERRKIRCRTTQNDCPTPEALEEQFARTKGSPEEMLRFGSLLEDLECYVDNSLIFDEGGGIAGRQGGIRGWLKEHCPALWARYKTVMRYKAMAKKFRQVTDVRDPVPATALLTPEPETNLRKQAETAKEFLAVCGHTQIDVLWQLERRLSPDWIIVRARQRRKMRTRNGLNSRRSGKLARKYLS